MGSEGCTLMCKRKDLDDFDELRFWMDGLDGPSTMHHEASK